MKTKLLDKPYCGVRRDKIDDFSIDNINIDSLIVFLHFIKERYKIFVKKDILKKEDPWTKDEILKKYRFCNIRRELDRNSKWLINNISTNDNLSYTEKIVNSILFRLYNNINTAEILKLPVNHRQYKYLAERTKNLPEEHFMTGAYMTSGMLRVFRKTTKTNDSKLSVVRMVQYMLKFYLLDYLISDLIQTQEDVYSVLKSYPGIAEFTAYQLFVDLTYIKEFPFSENEFTIAGPGAKQGLKYLFDDQHGLTPEELIFWLRDNWEEINNLSHNNGGKTLLNSKFLAVLPEEDRVMNVMSIENCLCEFSKYYKTLNGLGRPRKKYVRSTRP